MTTTELSPFHYGLLGASAGDDPRVLTAFPIQRTVVEMLGLSDTTVLSKRLKQHKFATEQFKRGRQVHIPPTVVLQLAEITRFVPILEVAAMLVSYAVEHAEEFVDAVQDDVEAFLDAREQNRPAPAPITEDELQRVTAGSELDVNSASRAELAAQVSALQAALKSALESLESQREHQST